MAKMITKEVLENLKKHPYLSKDGQGFDAVVEVYIFNPYGAGRWLITELDEVRDNGQIICFGYVNYNDQDAEFGSIDLTQLSELQVDVYGISMPLERELHSKGKTIRQIEAIHGHTV